MTDSLLNIAVSKADTPILPLVKRFFQSQGMRSQAAKIDEVIIARDKQLTGTPIIAALRLCPVKTNWILRSMSVKEEYQRMGIGLLILKNIKNSLSEKKCYCFPYQHLKEFYYKAGFQLIEKEEAPEEIKQLFKQYIEAGKDILIMQYKDN